MSATAWMFDGPAQPLRRTSLPLPEPAAGEVLVRIGLTTLCGSDLHTRAGRRATSCPTVLGHEIMGTIVALGPNPPRDLNGRTLAVGQRLTWTLAASCGACFFCLHDLPQKCERLRKYGHESVDTAPALFGGLASHVLLVPGTGLVVLPDALPDAVAAPANCAAATVAAALRCARPEPGETALVTGAGMLGLTAVAMLTEAGVRCVVVEPDEARRAQALSFGAVEVSPDRGVDPVRRLTGRRGADLALDFSGHAAAMVEGLAALRLGGRAVWVGAVFPAPPLRLSAEDLVRRCVTLSGVHNYAPRDLATAVEFLTRSHARWPFAELVARTFALDDVEAAFAHAEAARPVRVALAP